VKKDVFTSSKKNKNRFSSPNIYIFLTILFLIVEKEDKITSVMEFAQQYGLDYQDCQTFRHNLVEIGKLIQSVTVLFSNFFLKKPNNYESDRFSAYIL
jgi:hypothetical protein